MVILTDLSDVLVHGLYGVEERLAEIYGADVARDFWKRHLDTEKQFYELMRGNMSEDEYWYNFMQEGCWPFSIRKIKMLFSENLKKTMPGTLSVYQRIVSYPHSLRNLRDTIDGRPDIYIVSDHINERIDELHKYHPDVFAMAAKEFWSCEVGEIKMDDTFFPSLLRVLDMPVDEIIFIDDNVYNTTAASLVGITSIHFENAIQLERILKEYGFGFVPATCH